MKGSRVHFARGDATGGDHCLAESFRVHDVYRDAGQPFGETALNRAIELDERYDFGGPLCVLGLLYLRTPAPPVSIGSPRKGLRLLQHAVELFPDYPENYLYLAEALRDTGKPDEARKAIEVVLQASPLPDQQFESAKWKQDALKLLSELPDPGSKNQSGIQ